MKHEIKYVIQQRNGNLVRIEPDNRCAIWSSHSECQKAFNSRHYDFRIMKLAIIQYGQSAVVCVSDVKDEELYGSFVLQICNEEWLQFKLDEWIEPFSRLYKHSYNLLN